MMTVRIFLTRGRLMITVQGMFLRDLSPQHGIPSIAQLRRRLELTKTKQYAWMLWHGKISLSSDMLRRLHGELGIPLDALLQMEQAEPAKWRGRKTLPSNLQGRRS